MNSSSVEINSPVLVLVGPTAVGKTALTFDIADAFDCEIVSMDSMQVYRHMDIGTAKPSREEQQQVRHHLIDIVNPDEQYNAARFVQDCIRVVREIVEQGKIPLITGGTGLYLSSLINGLFDKVNVKDEVKSSLLARMELEGVASLHAELLKVDPVSGKRVHSNDRQRILRGLEIYHSTSVAWSTHLERQKNVAPPVHFNCLFEIALSCDREILHKRIKQRTFSMLDQGLVNEVEKVRSMGYDPELASMQAIGYRHVNQYLDGQWSLEKMIELLIRDTRRYAKRQMTWFRRHKSLHWYQRTESTRILKDMNVYFKSNSQ